MPNNTLMVGHSLVGTTMPQMLSKLMDSLSASLNFGSRVDAQIIIGAPLSYNWAHGATAQGVDARAVLPSGDYGTLVLTEAIPLATHIQWSDTYGAARNYTQLARAANPNTQVLIYETWHDFTTDAEWRAGLTRNLPLWQSIANHVNNSLPADQPDVRVLPAGQAMARLYDTIAVGNGAGITSIHALFADQIHLNDTGSYFVALVQFSGITHRSAVGLTNQFTTEWGQTIYNGTTAQANLFQHIAWEAVALAPGAILASGSYAPKLMTGGNWAETLSGGAGDDRIYGGGGNDTEYGGKGHDLMMGSAGSDMLYGGPGNDWMYAGSGNDQLYGGYGNDQLYGGTGNDQMFGSSGSETLSGGNGNDLMSAGSGWDLLTGGNGADTLVGGDGADSFVFTLGSDADTIRDFDIYEGDQLRLGANLWDGYLTDAQIVKNFAYVGDQGVVFDFGAGDRILLSGVYSLSGLAAHLQVL